MKHIFILFFMFICSCTNSCVASQATTVGNCENQDSLSPGNSIDFTKLSCNYDTICSQLNYPLNIDPQFTPEEVEEIKSALEDWKVSTNNTVQFYIVDFAPDANVYFSIYKSVDYFTQHNCDRCLGLTDSNIYINANICGTKSFNVAIRHELGHILDLQHSPNSGDVMYGNFSYSTLDYPNLQNGDIESYMNVRQCCVK